MCWLCDQYGDPQYGGGYYYLNPHNYSRNMYKLRAPGSGATGAGVFPEGGVPSRRNIPHLLDALETGDYNMAAEIREEIHAGTFTGGGGQVVALRDADKVLELSSPVGLIACICRKLLRAIDERNEHEYTCMGMGVGMLKWERWPERYKGGVGFVNVDEAKEWNHEMDRRGFVHILMLFGAPYIGGFCQCDYPDCMTLRLGVDFGLNIIKGHDVAMLDYDKCNGCGICVQRCQWGAVKFEVTTNKTNIDQHKCYGCGLCESGCPRNAIYLEPRANVPAVAEVWR